MSNSPLSRIDSLLQGVTASVAKATELEEEVLSLHDLLRPRLFRYAVSLGLKAQDAEDVIQEVFLALFRHLQAEKPRNNLEGWVFRVTHHLALRRRTRYGREDCAEESEGYSLAAGSEWSPEEQLIFSERQWRLRRTFAALPETDRLCLQLRVEGLKYREIAEVLGISLGSVANCMERSLSRLRRSVGGEP